MDNAEAGADNVIMVMSPHHFTGYIAPLFGVISAVVLTSQGT
jgi:hypothetical protein